MRLIPGVEITKNTLSNSRSAHIVVLNIDSWLDPNAPIDQILKSARNVGALTIAAHPVSTRKLEKQTYHLWDRRDELISLIDAWEVASGQILFQEVIDAKLPMIANSDLHQVKQLESWKTVFNGYERNIEKILNDIRNQNLNFKYYEPATCSICIRPRSFEGVGYDTYATVFEKVG